MATDFPIRTVADVTTLVRRVRALGRRSQAFDTVIAITVFGTVLLVGMVRPTELHGHLIRERLTVPGTIVLAAGCAALIWRRRWPRAVLATSIACALTYLVTGPTHGSATLVVVVAMYTVTNTAPRRTAVAFTVASAAILVVGDVVLAGGFGVDPNGLLDIVAVGLAFALGDAIRNRRAYLAEVVARAHRAEQSREREAQRRVVEERLRIARDLHDAVAHHIAVINIQAGVGEHLLDTDPEQARTALAHIRQASRSALEELSTTVGLLRQPGDPRAPTEPTVGLAHLPDLIIALSASGLHVDHHIAAPALPAGIDLAAYRIAQEALTNVHKHANTDRAVLEVVHEAAAIRITVDDNGTCGSSEPGSGHGMIGMRERAAAVGGTLTAGPKPSGGFRVEAVLPIQLSWS